MAISYNKLWKLLVDKKMSKADLRKAAGIAPNTMTRLRRDEEVTLAVLNKICSTLDVDIGDIMEFLPEDSNRSALSSDEMQRYQDHIKTIFADSEDAAAKENE